MAQRTGQARRPQAGKEKASGKKSGARTRQDASSRNGRTVPVEEAIRERLLEIDGCVELAVRINPLSPTDGQTASGWQYLPDKLSAQRRREALAESTLACLRELAVASKLAGSQTGDDTVGISYLVKAGRVETFSRAVGRLQRRWPQFALSCAGPWAPHSFAAQDTAWPPNDLR